MLAVVDANVLLPLLVDRHPHREPASLWWAGRPDESVILALPVRMTVLRLLTNRAVMGDGVLRPEIAWSELRELIEDARMVVRNDSPPGLDLLWHALVRGREPAPNIWTDAWLAAFAEAEGAEMVTFDRGFRQFPLSHLRLLGA